MGCGSLVDGRTGSVFCRRGGEANEDEGRRKRVKKHRHVSLSFRLRGGGRRRGFVGEREGGSVRAGAC